MFFSDSKCDTACCLAWLSLFVTVPKITFVKSLEMCGKQYCGKPSPSTISRTHHHHLKSRFGPQRLPFFCAWASADTFKLHAEYISTCGTALLCVILAVTARTRGRDVPCLSSHSCHACCGDKQEGIFNRRHFLCWSAKAQGWWPCRHSANSICFPRRWVFKQCRWWHLFFGLFFGTVYFVVSKLSMCNLLFSSELSMTLWKILYNKIPTTM